MTNKPEEANKKHFSPTHTVFVSRLHKDTSAEDLRSHFRECGSVTNVEILYSPKGVNRKGHAYLEFSAPAAVTNALRLHETALLGSPSLIVAPKRDIGGADSNVSIDFSHFPKYLREGPWSPVAYASLALMALGIGYVAVATEALGAYPATGESLLPYNPRVVSAAVGAYMLGVLAYMFTTIGAWPLASYTMTSWNLLTARFLTRAVAAPEWLHEGLRFPSVAGNTTTVAVWWIVLVPVLYALIPSKKGKRVFLKYNFSPFLLNVHFLNFPLCVLDHYLGPRVFVATDLWIGLVVGFIYLLWYLLVLDANGLHFYIILSPRTKLCIIAYLGVISVYFSIWTNWGVVFA